MSGDQGNLSADGRRPGADAVEAGNRIGVDVEPSSLWSDNLARCGIRRPDRGDMPLRYDRATSSGIRR